MTTVELFKVLSDKIDANHESTLRLLTNIEKETTKTNGTLRDHEKRINGIEVGESRHIIDCPRVADIQKLNDSLASLRQENELWRLVIRYPKLAIGTLVIAVIITLATVGYSILEMHTIIADFRNNIEQKK